MVLWELTLVTAYVLGLKRTYRLALRAQKRVLGTKYPRIRDFTERRTKAVFTMALNVHKEIQRRDISVGRNLSNRLLRLLDRARPQANIRGTSNSSTESGPGRPSQKPKLETKDSQSKRAQLVRLDDSADCSLSSYSTHLRGPTGTTLRSRITDGLKLRTRPSMRPLPAITTFGLWWQPVRRESGSIYRLPSSLVPFRSFETGKTLSMNMLRSGPGQGQQSIFRDDIARLMRSQRST